MPDWLKATLLGIVEGLTEFLPVSSTGHLIVAAALLDFGAALGGTFEIFIQFGAVVAIVLFYRVDLWKQVRAVGHDAGVRRFWLAVLIAFVPFAAVGFLFSDTIKETLFSPTVVAISLIVGGLIFLIVERLGIASRASTRELTDVRWSQAAAIGIAQVFAIIPGVSRAGASIVGALLTGLDRQTATQFSFYLAIPTLGIATLYDLVRNLDRISGADLVNMLIGATVAGVVAWLSIRWLLRFVSRNSFVPFGFYRILAGAVILILVAASLL